MNNRIYLDYASATPLAEEVKKEIIAISGYFNNPSTTYQSGLKSKEFLDSARKEVAMFLQANVEEIVFTSGATESNNIAILGIAKAFGEGRVISIQTEHSSVSGPLHYLAGEGFELVNCSVDRDGKVDLEELKSLLSKNTIMVTISYANSEIGTIQPINKIGQLIRAFNAKEGADIKFHTDASAAALLLPCDVSRLGVDMLSIGGSKIYGPQAVGALYVKRGTYIEPLMYGGNQEFGLRPGSEPVDLTVGIGKALSLAVRNREKDKHHFVQLNQKLKTLLKNSKLKHMINSPQTGMPNIVSFSLDNQDGEDLLARLDAKGIEVATGAACEASNEEPNRALIAIGLTKEQAQASLRISFGRSTSIADIEVLIHSLSDII